MLEEVRKSLVSWKISSNDRVKLQHTYIVLSLIMFVISGIVSLASQSIGQSLLLVSLSLFVIFLINAIIWSWLDSGILRKLPTKNSTAKRK